MSIKDNLEQIRESILSTEIKAGIPENTVQLVAVSKFHPASSVVEALNAGQRIFGENRVQEAFDKFTPLLADNSDIELHMIGSLQRNKVGRIITVASCIQSVDRISLLQEIEKKASSADRTISVLFEFHTGEESKAGFTDESSLFKAIDILRDCPHVRCAGLMTMAPFTTDEKEIRNSFRLLKTIQTSCERSYPSFDFSTLSMGMSNDYKIAIEEGSTMVRVGTAIFGTRTT